VSKAGRRRAAAASDAGVSGAAAPAPAWRYPLLAALVALLVYAPSIAGGFVYDDGELILRNPSIHDLKAWRSILGYEPARPLLTWTWALNYAVGGDRAWSYHLVNVLVHAGSAALAFSLFDWMARRLDRPQPRERALLGACLFAASPMAAETIAYVASRSSALVALLGLGSLRLAASVLAGGPRRRLAGALALFLLAAATKEEAAAVPLLLVLLDYFFVAGQRLSDLRRRWWVHAGFLALLPLGLAARRVLTGAWLPPPAIPTGLYLLTQCAAFPLYLARAVLPFDPALYRGHPASAWPPGPLTVLGVLLFVSIAVVAVRIRRTRPEWAFAIAALAAGLLPSSSFVPLNEMVVDHRAYFGSFGIAFATGDLLWRLGRARLGLVAVLLLAARSLSYEWVLADPVRAWEDAVRRAPRSTDALSALGESYAARGDRRAEAAFQQAVKAAPENYRYWANLGLYYADQRRYEEAARALRTAAEKSPREASVRDYLGQILLGLGREDEAASEFEAAIAAEPTFAQAYINLATLRLRRGQPAGVREMLATAARYATSAEEAEAIAGLQRQLP
jgi:protein O-mannosyl-transferase